MRFENLIQILVPLIFLAIWTLTSAFNRDARPLPPRGGTGRGPDGEEPSAGNESRREDERPRDRLSAGGPTTSPFLDRRPPSRPPDNAVVVVEGDPRRASQSRPAPSGVKKGGRNRGGVGSGARTSESTVTRGLSDEMSRSQVSLSNSHEALRSLSAPGTPLLSAERGLKASILARTTDETPPNRGSVMGERQVGPTIARLRDAFILSDVLFRPPLALRRPLPVRRKTDPPKP